MPDVKKNSVIGKSFSVFSDEGHFWPVFEEITAKPLNKKTYEREDK